MARRKRKVVSGDDTLAAIRSAINNTASFGSSFNFWTPKKGETAHFRLLPPVKGMPEGAFFVQIAFHFLKRLGGPNDIVCPRLTFAKNEPCPICELRSKLLADGEEQIANLLRPSKKYLMNAVVREEGEKPVVYDCRTTAFQQIVGIIGEYGVDIFDLEEGWDLSVRRDGEGLNTVYNVMVHAKAGICALSKDPDTVDEILEEAPDLYEYAQNGLNRYSEEDLNNLISELFGDGNTSQSAVDHHEVQRAVTYSTHNNSDVEEAKKYFRKRSSKA